MTLSIRAACAALLVALAAVLAGCGSAPPRGGGAAGVPVRPGPAPSGDRDGPEANPPTDLSRVPDAEPKIEPIRAGGPNKPYEVLGRDYRPITEDRPFSERGLASWYGKKFHGRRTASGEIYNMYAMTAAHPTLPIPSYVRVRNPANDREVVVRINDRGPFHAGRIIDLSYTAALKLGLLRGVAPVELSRITFEEIRAGSWRRDANVPDGSAMAVASRDASPRRASSGALKPGVAAEQEPSANAPVVVGTTPSPALPSPVTPVAPVPTSSAVSVAGVSSTTQAPATGPAPASSSVIAGASPSSADPVSMSSGAADPQAPDAKGAAASVRPAPGFWVQLGVFRQRDGADGFHRRVVADLDWLAPLLAVFSESGTYRLQAGPYANRDQAQDAARRVREALNLVPVIVERR
jgi:rare lipoprotein A